MRYMGTRLTRYRLELEKARIHDLAERMVRKLHETRPKWTQDTILAYHELHNELIKGIGDIDLSIPFDGERMRVINGIRLNFELKRKRDEDGR